MHNLLKVLVKRGLKISHNGSDLRCEIVGIGRWVEGAYSVDIADLRHVKGTADKKLVV